MIGTGSTPLATPALAIVLTEQQIRQIARALHDVGDYGEVHLIKEKGRLRFIRKVTSEDALAPEPGGSRLRGVR
jgi:hypothetical protein